MECGVPRKGGPYRGLPPYFIVSCLGGDSVRKELAPIGGLEGQDEAHVDRVAVEIDNADLSKLEVDQALPYLLALADIPSTIRIPNECGPG
jgi:hypothetical protein